MQQFIPLGVQALPVVCAVGVGPNLPKSHQTRGCLGTWGFIEWRTDVRCGRSINTFSRASTPAAMLEDIAMVAPPNLTDFSQILPDEVAVVDWGAVSAFVAHILSVILRI